MASTLVQAQVSNPQTNPKKSFKQKCQDQKKLIQKIQKKETMAAMIFSKSQIKFTATQKNTLIQTLYISNNINIPKNILFLIVTYISQTYTFTHTNKYPQKLMQPLIFNKINHHHHHHYSHFPLVFVPKLKFIWKTYTNICPIHTYIHMQTSTFNAKIWSRIFRLRLQVNQYSEGYEFSGR